MNNIEFWHSIECLARMIYKNVIIIFQTCFRRVIDTINKTFDFNMFTEFHFLIMNLSTLVLFIWFIVPYFYVTTLMTMNNYTSEDGTWMLSILGVANIIGIVSYFYIIISNIYFNLQPDN